MGELSYEESLSLVVRGKMFLGCIGDRKVGFEDFR